MRWLDELFRGPGRDDAHDPAADDAPAAGWEGAGRWPQEETTPRRRPTLTRLLLDDHAGPPHA